MRTDHLERSARTISAKKRTHKRWMRVVSTLAAITVFCTTYALILPAITISANTYCGLDEHEHTDACYERRFICGYDEEGIVEKSVEGVAGDAAPTMETETQTVTETVLVDAGHIHDDSCYEIEKVLTCENTEEDHEHTDACYEEVRTLICGEEEREAVYEEREVEAEAAPLVAAVPEVALEEEHVHTEECYDKVLVCEKPEHKHTDECRANKEADLETASIWENTLPEKSEMNDDWKKDTLLIAQSQLGYRESEANFIVVDEEHKGYTRYGEMMGSPYGDWCAMFLQFSLHYAGVDVRAMAGNPSVPLWMEQEIENENFHKADDKDYEPKSTDLIFFEWEGDESPDHIGIIEEIKKNDDGKIESIITIEGNSQNEVRKNSYKADDKHIFGFAEIPDKMTEEELQALVGDREKAAEKKAEAIEKAMHLSFELEHAEVEATIYTDDTYQTIADDDETKIFVTGMLPYAKRIDTEDADKEDAAAEDADTEDADKEEPSPELAVEVKAYPIEMESPSGAKMILSYDIKILYKEEFKTLDTGDEFQPTVPVSVSFESPLLTEDKNSGTRFNVYHTTDEGVTELVAAESRISQTSKDVEEMIPAEAKTSDLTEEEKELAEATNTLDELTNSIENRFENENTYETLISGRMELISKELAEAIAGNSVSANLGVDQTAETYESAEMAQDAPPLIVKKDEENVRITFEASHFSPYGVSAEKQGDYEDRTDEAEVTSIQVLEDGATVNPHHAHKNQTVKLTISAQKKKDYNFGVGDYFTIALPEELDFRGLVGSNINADGNGGFKGLGKIYYKDGKPYLDIEITTVGTEPSLAVFGFAANVPFDFTRSSVVPNANLNMTAKSDYSGATPATTNVRLNNYNDGVNRNLTSDAEVTGIGVFGMNLSYSSMEMQRLERGETDTTYTLRVNFKWNAGESAPHIKAGDYIVIDMPAPVDGFVYRDPFGMSFPITKIVTNPVTGVKEEVQIADAVYNPETGKATITFNDNVGTSGDAIYAGGYFPMNVSFTTTGIKRLTATTEGKSGKSTNIKIGQESVVSGTWKAAEYPYYYELSSYTATTKRNGSTHKSTGITTFLLYPAGNKPNWNSIRANQQWYKADGTDPYAVVYCADHDTDYAVSTFNKYPVMQAPNTKLDETTKKKMSGIVTHSYPFVSAADMYKALGLTSLTPDEDVAMTAAQLALWDVINNRTLTSVSQTSLSTTAAEYMLKARQKTWGRQDDVWTVYNALKSKALDLYNDSVSTASDDNPITLVKGFTQIVSQQAINSDGDQEYWVQFKLSRKIEEDENLDSFVLAASSSTQDKYKTVITQADLDGNSANFQWIDKNASQPTFKVRVVVPVNETQINFSGKINGAIVETVTPYYYYNGHSQSMIGAEKTDDFGCFELNDTIPIVPDIAIKEYTKLVVEKKWYDADGTEMTSAPSGINSIQVQLYKNGRPEGEPVTITPGTDGKWRYEWPELQTKETINGVTYVYSYSVKEVNVPAGYRVEYDEVKLETHTTTGGGYRFVRMESLSELTDADRMNSVIIYAPGKGYLRATNAGFYWDSTNDIQNATATQNGYWPSEYDDAIWRFSKVNDVYQEYFDLYHPATNKSLYDTGLRPRLMSSDDALRGDFKVAKLYPTSGSEARMIKFYNRATSHMDYITGHGATGTGEQLELMTWTDINSALNFYFYSWKYSDTKTETYLLAGINNIAAGNTEVEVEKKWQDENGNPTDVPVGIDSITVKLLQNGQEVDTINGVSGTQILNAGNSWKYKWENLPVYDENGEKYTYQVIEIQPEGYDLVDIYVNKVKTKIGGGNSSSGEGGPGTGSTGSAQGTVGPITNTTNTVLQAAQTDPDISRSISFTSSDYINYSEHTGNQVQIISNQGALAYDGSSIRWQTRKTGQSNNSYDDVRKQLWKVVYSGNQTGSSEYNGYYYNLQNVYDPNVYLSYNSSEYFTVGSSDDLGYFGSSSSYKNRLIGYVDGWRYWNYGNISGVNRDYFTRYKSNGGNITYHKINSNLTTGSHPYVPGASDSVTFGLSGTDHTIDTYGRVLFDAVGDVATITQNVSSSNSQYTVTYNISGDAGVISVAQDGTVTALADGDATVVATVNTGNTTQSKAYAFRVSLPAAEPDPEDEGPADDSDAADDEYVSKYEYRFTNRKSTYIYDVKLLKVASENKPVKSIDDVEEQYKDMSNNPAKFELYVQYEDEWDLVREVEVTMNSNREVALDNLEAGRTYRLVEIEAPAGRKLLEVPVEFTITAGSDGTGFVTWNGSPLNITGPALGGNAATIVIPNERIENGVELPHTGGIGTVIFTVLGVVLVVGAALALLLSRSKRRD